MDNDLGGKKGGRGVANGKTYRIHESPEGMCASEHEQRAGSHMRNDFQDGVLLLLVVDAHQRGKVDDVEVVQIQHLALGVGAVEVHRDCAVAEFAAQLGRGGDGPWVVIDVVDRDGWILLFQRLQDT